MSETDPTTTQRLVVQPNASLSRRGARQFVWAVLVGILGVAGVIGTGVYLSGHGFAPGSAWPVFVFAGVNIIAVGVALTVSLRRNDHREVLSFKGDEIHIECGFVGRGKKTHHTLPRRSTRAMVEPGPYRTSPTVLVLRSNDEVIEVGRGLTDDERVSLCRRIRELLQPGWTRPPPVSPGVVDPRTRD